MFSWSRSVKLKNAASRLADEQLYAYVLREAESGRRRDGLWAKAVADSRGNEGRAKALYIDYLVQALRDEAVVAQAEQSSDRTATQAEPPCAPEPAKDEEPRSSTIWIYVLVGAIALLLLVVFLSSLRGEKMTSIAYVKVYLDEEVPDYMQGIIRCGSVVSEDENGEEIQAHKELVDNREYHSAKDLIDDVAKRLGVNADQVEIQS